MADEKDALVALQSLVRILSENGLSYPKLAEHVPSVPKWTNSALKAFVARGQDGKVTDKIKRLAEEVQLQLFHRPKLAETTVVKEALDRIAPLTENSGIRETFLAEMLTQDIGKRFQRIRRSGNLDTWPDRLAFVRPTQDNARLVILMLQIRGSDKGHSFIMKIQGGRSNRRIIIGDILKCEGTTYFSGLAYNVIKPLDTREFFSLDMFDRDVLSEIAHPSEIGLECFSILQSEVTAAFAPANFHGLDGSGKPICGVGVVINPLNFEAFGIDESKFTAVVPIEDNPKLAGIMKDFGATTVAPLR